MMQMLDQSLFDTLTEKAAQSPRLRSNHNLHRELSDPVQRLLIALQPGTYVRPHHHPDPNKWELLTALQGTLFLVIFDAQSTVLDKRQLHHDGPQTGVEMPAGTWHTVFPVGGSAVFLEVKAGPYTPAEASDFASWAPAEGDEEVAAFLHWLERCEIGQRFEH